MDKIIWLSVGITAGYFVGKIMEANKPPVIVADNSGNQFLVKGLPSSLNTIMTAQGDAASRLNGHGIINKNRIPGGLYALAGINGL